MGTSTQQHVEPLPGHVIRLTRVHPERMDFIPKASDPGRWIVLFEKLGLKTLPSGDIVVWKGVKPGRCTPREREWEETQIDRVLRHTRDIEGITYDREARLVFGFILILEAMKLSDLTPLSPSLALWCTELLASGSALPMIGNGIGLV
ncbi:hypothetical protein L1987_06256 [Smallanthus sonchifolius]|uniref:Uncharacterized protein n=1 Tax=Smallanthus sonchifolius TaxID=185202 RepID=A0ACB9JXS5_9ASTR|nr:hypothetical protein L1987_06256 [Smallanthus sonchifolius]